MHAFFEVLLHHTLGVQVLELPVHLADLNLFAVELVVDEVSSSQKDAPEDDSFPKLFPLPRHDPFPLYFNIILKSHPIIFGLRCVSFHIILQLTISQ